MTPTAKSGVDAKSKLRLKVVRTGQTVFQESLESVWKGGQVFLTDDKKSITLSSDSLPKEPLRFWIENQYHDLKFTSEFGDIFTMESDCSVTIELPEILAKIS